MAVSMQVSGFAVIRPDGRVMLVETFSTDEMKCRRRFHFGNYSTMTWEDCVQSGYRVGVVSVSTQYKEMNMEEKLKAFKQAVITAHSAFAQNKAELTDLSAKFWASWMDLELALEWNEPFEEIKATFQKAYKQFGAPGDFGYGTPCGDGLKAVYDAWREVVAASQPTAAAAS